MTIDELKKHLLKINGAGYKAYKDIQGTYSFQGNLLFIDHVQADPFAPPSKIRLRVPMEKTKFPSYLFEGVRLTALEDIIARKIREGLQGIDGCFSGTGKSGMLYIDAGRQEIIKRSAVKICPDFVEARLSVGLPASGRRVKGKDAQELLCSQIPSLALNYLYYEKLNEKEIQDHVFLFEDQEYIRAKLADMGLLAFIGNDSILPRKSGNSNLPMPEKQAIKFQSPGSMEVAMETLHHGTIRGMGIAEGITLIVGGGYHGKTTLLKALERGVYNHIPGDGREWVITIDNAVKIRAEDGRNVEKVDIRCFIDNLPFGQNTREFSTENASGSTSQAANIMEAVEAGTELLLLDEDTSATNFMIRDARMQKLVSKDKEPITPFIDRVGQLYEEKKISSILVIGGAGDYLDVAHRVIMLDSYRVFDVSDEAQRVAGELGSQRVSEQQGNLEFEQKRIIKSESFNMLRTDRKKVSARGLYTVVLGRENIELDAVEQIVDSSQTRAIAECLRYLSRYVDNQRSLQEILDLMMTDINRDLEVISPFKGEQHPGEIAKPRRHELAAALNRLRSLKIK